MNKIYHHPKLEMLSPREQRLWVQWKTIQNIDNIKFKQLFNKMKEHYEQKNKYTA